MSTAKRFQPHGLLGEQGGVQTFAGRDAMNGLPVRVYSFMGTPTSREGELRSDFIPPVLSATTQGGAGEVVTAFSESFQKLKGAVAPAQVEALLKETAAALDDAARAGVVHGDLSPERVFYDREAGGRFVLEGYGVPWRVRPSEFSAPERIGGPSFAGDVFAWARTVKHLSGPLPGELRDLLDRCLSADPAARPHAHEVRGALGRFPFPGTARGGRAGQSPRDTTAFEAFVADPPGSPGDAVPDPLGGLTLLPEADGPTDPRPSPVRVVQPGGDGAARGEPTLLPKPETPKPGEDAPPPHLEREAASPVPASSGPVSSNTASRAVRVLPAAEPSRPREGVRQVDATAAYRARLEAYRAKQEGAPPTEVAAPPKVRRAPAAALEQGGAPGSADEGAENADFDDVNDRAPDPTLYRGGRRVLLLTLLGIALLVLVALQLINA